MKYYSILIFNIHYITFAKIRDNLNDSFLRIVNAMCLFRFLVFTKFLTHNTDICTTLEESSSVRFESI